MQFNIDFVFDKPHLVIGALFISIIIKAVIAGFSLRLTGMSVRSAVGCGIMVGQVGEFSFVLVNSAFVSLQPLNTDIHGLIVSVACLSLALTPLLISIATHFLPKSKIDSIVDKGETIVVAGLGPVGNTVVKALHENGQPLMLIDRNEKLLEPWVNTEGITCHQGKIEVMEEWLPILGTKPRIMVLTFPIVDASALVAERLLKVDPELIIIARSPYEAQIDTLYNAGVRYVICDERETARALSPLLDEILGHESGILPKLKTSNYRKMSTQEIDELSVNQAISEQIEKRDLED